MCGRCWYSAGLKTEEEIREQTSTLAAPGAPSVSETAVKLVHGSAIYGVANFGIRGLNFFLLIPLYTRYLTPSDYGTVSLAESIGVLLVSITSLGIDDAMRRLYFQYKDDREALSRYLATVLNSSAVLFAATVLASWLFGSPVLHFVAPRFAVPFSPYVMVAIATACVAQVVQYRLILYQLEQRAKQYATLAFCVFFLTAGACVVMVVALQKGALGMLTGKLIASGASAILCAFSLGRWMRYGFDWRFMKESLRFGLPMVPYGLAALGLDVADRFILQRYRPTAEVGLYTLAYSFGMVMYVITLSLWQAWAPLYYAAAKAGDDSRAGLGRLTSGVIVSLVGIAVIGQLLAPHFVRLMLNPSYAAAGRVIPLLISAYLCHALYALFQLAALQEKKTPQVFFITLICFATNLSMNFLFIPRFGMYGAAYATLLAFAIEAVLMYDYAQRVYFLPYNRSQIAVALLVLFAVLASTQSGSASPMRAWPSALVGTCAFGVLLILNRKEGARLFAALLKWGS